jgi:hypothetical protein
MILACTTPVSATRAQVAGTAEDLHRLRTALQQHALELLQRDGVTFYALAALVGPDGSVEEFTPDHWPDLEAPPPEWQDSLVQAFHRMHRPARAVAMLVDWGIVPDTLPRDTFAIFHGETGTLCQESREPITGMGIGGGSMGWGEPGGQPCRRRFWARPDTAG